MGERDSRLLEGVSVNFSFARLRLLTPKGLRFVYVRHLGERTVIIALRPLKTMILTIWTVSSTTHWNVLLHAHLQNTRWRIGFRPRHHTNIMLVLTTTQTLPSSQSVAAAT